MNKFAHVINKLENIPSIDYNHIFSEIKKFITECQTEAESNNKSPVKHHVTPKFILNDLAGSIGTAHDRLYVIRYEFDSNNNVKKPRLILDVKPTSFSQIKDFYSVRGDDTDENKSDSQDKFRVEKLLSEIETRAAPLIKTRQSTRVNAKVRRNPYFYEKNESYFTAEGREKNYFVTQESQRLALAVFFAAQYLRSVLMFNSFNRGMENNLIQNYEDKLLGTFSGTSFGEFIEYLLPWAALTFYFRSWRWVYSKYDLFIPSGTSLVAFEDGHVQQPLEEEILCMPLGKNIGIYFSCRESFVTSHDGVFYSKSLVLNMKILDKLSVFAAIDAVSPTSRIDKNGNRKFEIAMSPDSDLAYAIITDKDPDGKLDAIIADITDPRRKCYEKDFSFLDPIPRV